MKSVIRYSAILACLMFAESSARANEFMFSEATIGVVGPAFLGWLVIGLVLIVLRIKIQWMGVGSVILVVLGLTLFEGHFEVLSYFWMVYLTLLTAYYAWHPLAKTLHGRRANLIYHGSFLGLILLGGIAAKVAFYSRMGGFARWATRMREIFPGFLVFFFIFGLLCWAWVGTVVFLRGRNARKEQ